MKVIAWDCAAIGRVRVVQRNGKTKHWPYECGDRVIEQLLGSLLVAAKFGGRKETLDKDAFGTDDAIVLSLIHIRKCITVLPIPTSVLTSDVYIHISLNSWI